MFQSRRMSAGQSTTQIFQELGEIVWLASHSDMHAKAQIDELVPLFLRPLELNQMRRWYRNGVIVGLATWALLDQSSQDAYLETGQVSEGKWASGGNMWFIDVIAPFGDVRPITRELRGFIPSGTIARSARWNPDGSLRKIGQFASVPQTA